MPKRSKEPFSPQVLKSVWQEHFVCYLMVAGGKWWDLKVGFNIAHSQSLCMDSQQDFGENLLTKGSMDAFDGIFHACLKLAFQFFSFNHPLQTNLGIQDAFFFRFCSIYYHPLFWIKNFPPLFWIKNFTPLPSLLLVLPLYFVPFITLMNRNSKSSIGTKRVVNPRGELFSIFFGWNIL